MMKVIFFVIALCLSVHSHSIVIYGELPDQNSINFEVYSDSTVSFDILSFGYFETFFDSTLRVIRRNDGEVVAFNDDEGYYGGPGYEGDPLLFGNDGSLIQYDSYLELWLTAGSYKVDIGVYPLISGLQFLQKASPEEQYLAQTGGCIEECYVPSASGKGQYQLTMLGDSFSVSEPAFLSLLALGLAGLVFSRQRRSS
jgi:hypothetical protein